MSSQQGGDLPATATPQKRKAIPVAYQADFSKYLPSIDRDNLVFKGMKVFTPESPSGRASYGAVQFQQSKGSKRVNRVTLYRKIRMANYVQNPYSDGKLQKFEAGVRRNWAIRAALAVREFFVFSKGSELVIELPAEETLGKNEQQKAELVKQKTQQYQRLLMTIDEIDRRLKTVEAMRTFYWQGLTFGRAIVVKFFKDEFSEELIGLKPVNSRRMGDVVCNDLENMRFEGVILDGQGLDKSAMIYGAYQDLQLSPHTEYYGYSALETAVDIAEGLNVVFEEDFKEIFKSAWLASILFQINTEGLDADEALNKIKAFIDAIRAGKFIGYNEAVTATPIDLKPNFDGLVKAADAMEQRVFKALHVPQWMVQSEGIANRATAITAATQFLNGVISKDQEWLTGIMQEQHYDPLVRYLLKSKPELFTPEPLQTDKPETLSSLQKPDVKKPEEQTQTAAERKPSLLSEMSDLPSLDDSYNAMQQEEKLPFRVKRVFNQAKVAEFVDLADALVALVQAGVWDIQKANEVLGSEEVTPRAIAEKQRKENMINEQMQNKNNATDGELADSGNGSGSKAQGDNVRQGVQDGAEQQDDNERDRKRPQQSSTASKRKYTVKIGDKTAQVEES